MQSPSRDLSRVPLLDGRRAPFCADSFSASAAAAPALADFPPQSTAPAAAPPAPRLTKEKDGSYDFSEYISPVADAFLRTRSRGDAIWRAAKRYFILLCVGISVGVVASFLLLSARYLTAWKFSAVDSLIRKELLRELPAGTAFTVFALISMGYAGVAVACALIEPAAAGSGIPEIKAVLNGVRLPHAIRMKTVWLKAIGNSFSVSSNLPVGFEGPMIAVGGILGAALSQGKSILALSRLRLDLRWSVFTEFRVDREKRDFIAAGAAAGIAAAFTAPIGGVLFAAEELATHWHKKLFVRALFTAMVAVYVTAFLTSGVNAGQWGELTIAGLFSFGTFTSTEDQVAWSWRDMPACVLLGMAGGAIGALIVRLSLLLAKFRITHVSPYKRRRVAETALVSLVVSATAFWLPYGLGSCLPRPGAGPTAPYSQSLVQFYCPDGQFSDLASFWMASSEDGIRQLFHLRDVAFSLSHLAMFFVSYLLLLIVSSGLSLPAGTFIPSLLAGSAMGRLAGEAAAIMLPSAQYDVGTYSLIGAASMLGGVTRAMLPLLAILIECTADVQVALPLVTCLFAARFVGNALSPSLVDGLIEVRKLPVLHEVDKMLAAELRVSDVMTPKPLVVRDVECVATVMGVLQRSHDAFPVIFTDSVMQRHPRLGNLAGIITRRNLAILLAEKAFTRGPVVELFGADLEMGATESGNGAAAAFASASAAAAAAAAGGGVLPLGGVGGFTSTTRSPRASSTSSSQHSDAEGANGNGNGGSTAGEGRRKGGRHGGGGGGGLDRVGSSIRLRAPSVTADFSTFLAAAAAEASIQEGGWPGGEHEAAPLLGARQHGSAGELLAPCDAPQRQRSAERDLALTLYRRLWAEAETGEEVPLLYADLARNYPRFPDPATVEISAEEQKWLVDLRPYVDPAPVTVTWNTPLSKAYQLFVTMGLRHLIVVNNNHDVCGIISRANLTDESLSAARERVMAMQSP